MKPLLFTFTLLCLLSCGGNQSSQMDNNDITREVRQILTNYHNDIREHGLTAEFKYLDTSADFFWIPPGFGRALGYDTVRAIIERNAISMGTVDLHWDSLSGLSTHFGNRKFQRYRKRLDGRYLLAAYPVLDDRIGHSD